MTATDELLDARTGRRPLARLAVQARLLARLRDADRLPAACFVLMKAGQALLPALTALCTGALIRSVQRYSGRSGAGSHLAGPLIALAVTLMLAQVLTALERPLSADVIARINTAHRGRLSELALSAPSMSLLERPQVQTLLHATSGETSSWVEKSVAEGTVGVVGALTQYLSAVAAAVAMGGSAWWLAPTVIVPAYLVRRLALRESAELYRRTIAGLDRKRRFMYLADLSIAPSEGKEIRVFGLRDWLMARGRQSMTEFRRPVNQHEFDAARRRPVQVLLAMVPLAVAFWGIGTGIGSAGHQGSLASAAVALTAAGAVFMIVSSNADAMRVLGALPTQLAYEQLRTVLEPPAAQPPAEPPAQPDAEPDGEPAGDAPVLRFEHVDFAHEGSARNVLEGLDLEIQPGELVALVGANGVGKSTLAKLLTGVCTPSRGTVTADGRPLAEIGQALWRQRIAAGFQDFNRYPLSLRDNVTFGSAAVAHDRLLAEVVGDTGIGELLDQLPRGWDTPLSRTRAGGVDLSGGQWQQVVLARAVYAVRRGAQVLVLDEPTAHVDVRTEFEVFRRLSELRDTAGRRITVILISHRLSTVRQADRILVLDRGAVHESGSHRELMDLGGLYAGMFTTQAERFRQGYDDRIDRGGPA